jgi:hypothetical protein
MPVLEVSMVRQGPPLVRSWPTASDVTIMNAFVACTMFNIARRDHTVRVHHDGSTHHTFVLFDVQAASGVCLCSAKQIQRNDFLLLSPSFASSHCVQYSSLFSASSVSFISFIAKDLC